MSESFSTPRSICVYCGSRNGARAEYAQAARALGEAIAGAGIRLVYGGAGRGLMGELADGALAAGGEVLGVLPETLLDREPPHQGISELRLVASMHVRKLTMMEAADAFIAMPGGFGTLEELFEVLTWHQIGWHDKPVALFDVDGFYAPLVRCIAHMRDEGFVAAQYADRVRVAQTPQRLLAELGAGARVA